MEHFYPLLKKNLFESVVLVFIVVYGVLYLTPSSYGYVLSMLGMQGEGLFWGMPRSIRSDEWAVSTPYLQALANNHFGRFNELSIYREDFRNFNSLPIFDWALFFKPQFWPFLFFEPARAFSIHHGLIIAAFLTGWKRLPQTLLGDYPEATTPVFILFSLLLFFSAFVQVWWTTLGPVLAIYPWLIIALLAWRENSILYYVMLSYIAAVWLLSHTYPPIIISCSYLGLFLLLGFQPCFFSDSKRLILSTLACAAAIGIAAFYYTDVISIMMNTVYPGQRVSSGGGETWFFWLSTLLPYIIHSNFESLAPNSNICEAGAVSSLLPLIALCFSDFRSITPTHRRHAAALILCALFFSVWMLFPVPDIIGKALLLSQIPPHRLLFALGVAFNLIALQLLLSRGFQTSYIRWLIFSMLVTACWNLPAFFSDMEPFQKSGWELLSIPALLLVTFVAGKKSMRNSKLLNFGVSTAFLINFVYFAKFNPIQSAKPIFEASGSKTVAALKALQEEDSRSWLVIQGYPGAVLNGLGLRSFTHVQIQPQLDFFRALFPEIPKDEFNQIFNRYAHIQLGNEVHIHSPQPDVIRIPLQRIRDKKT
ncbi:MAG: DUF7657 domain-containing protein, partial [Gammaproteobacteria bacterium]